jgi:CheY-like chemotaxis protein
MKDGLPFRILIVDDDLDDQDVIDEAFMEIGYGTEVKKLINGKALLHYLEQLDASLYPSLIVLDNTLPELDAAQLLSILKANASYRHIPVVVYTAMLTPMKEGQLLSKGAYACYEKGSTMKEVNSFAKELRRLAEENLPKP